MKTIAVVSHRLKGTKDIIVSHYDLSDPEQHHEYEAHIDSHRAIKDDDGNYIQQSAVDYMVTAYELEE